MAAGYSLIVKYGFSTEIAVDCIISGLVDLRVVVVEIQVLTALEPEVACWPWYRIYIML